MELIANVVNTYIFFGKLDSNSKTDSNVIPVEFFLSLSDTH